MQVSGLSEGHADEVARGERFGFGENWTRFLNVLNEERIREAELSLSGMLGVSTLEGLTFLDIGSGSGLFSLAARRLGARVYSFDFDPHSVACTNELRRRYFPDDEAWRVEERSVLDASFMRSIGQFDIVYSWGVLHHTGDMWLALEHAATPVKTGGKLFIAIYNDQGGGSKRWKALKIVYNRLPAVLRPIYTVLVMGTRELRFFAQSCLSFKLPKYIKTWTEYKKSRGMSRWHDLVDWIGGFPFEVAKPEQVFEFYHSRGYQLRKMKTDGGGIGCNEFVFEKT